MALRLGDADKEKRERTLNFVDFVFKFAEQLLVVGIFSFLAQATGHWGVTAIAIILNVLLGYSIAVTLNSYLFTAWNKDDRLWRIILWRGLDVLIYAAIFYTWLYTMGAVLKAMREGTGI
jgi:hypothetical protein